MNKAILIAALMSANTEVPKHDCAKCYYKDINPENDGGHCYMFKEEPKPNCGQYRIERE